MGRLGHGGTGKQVSNERRESPSDPDAWITQMQDGAAHLACKAEHAVDLHLAAIVAATVTTANRGDGQTGPGSFIVAHTNLIQGSSLAAIGEGVAGNGYPDNRLPAQRVDRDSQSRNCFGQRPVFLLGEGPTL